MNCLSYAGTFFGLGREPVAGPSSQPSLAGGQALVSPGDAERASDAEARPEA
jgi:hypothetical protein